jgi:hypothetical protein
MRLSYPTIAPELSVEAGVKVAISQTRANDEIALECWNARDAAAIDSATTKKSI